MDSEIIKTFTVEKEVGSQVIITGELPYAELVKERSAAIKKLGKNVELDGFRKGQVPESVLVKHLGDMTILGEMAERAIAKAYPLILKEHKIDAIGYPQINLTKLAPDNPLGFTATVAVVPKFDLPDFKALAASVNKDKPSTDVTDEDIDTQTKDILRQKVAYERLQAKAAAKAAADQATTLPTPESEAQKAEADKDATPSDDELPELTDEYVKTLGQPGQFESVEDFKAKLREHLAIEKEREVTANHRAKITDTIVEATTIDVPKVLVNAEIEQMFAQMNEDLNRANLKLEDYLEHIKKTKDDLIKEWSPAAESRAKLQLILNKIAEVEQVTPNQGAVDQQVDALKQQYKDADENRVRVYVESILQNEAVMKLLEEQK